MQDKVPANSNSPLKVFLAYADQNLTTAQELYGRLEQVPGIKPWAVYNDIFLGQDREQAIKKAIQNADVVIVLLSKAVEQRNLINRQLRLAFDYYKEQPHDAIFLIPVLIEPCELPAELEGLYAVKYNQSNFWEQLAAALQKQASTLGIQLEIQSNLASSTSLADTLTSNKSATQLQNPTSATNPANPEPQNKLQADVVLMTVTTVETRAVLDVFREKLNREAISYFDDPNVYYDLGEIKGARVALVRTEMGNIKSMAVTAAAIQALSPNAIIMVGIAFGANEQKQKIGDILVSQQLHDYELQRVGANGQVSRGATVEPPASILSKFRAGEDNWNGAPLEFGLVLSGQKLVDNKGFKTQLVRKYPGAIGGDMEGVGLYSAANLAKTDWILVKAICDWADGNKGQDKENRQKLAATNAAQFTLFVLERGGFASKS